MQTHGYLTLASRGETVWNKKKSYNLRARKICFAEGQEIHRRNFWHSDVEKGYNA